MLKHRLLFGSLLIAGFIALVTFDGWLAAESLRGLSLDAAAVHLAIRCALPLTAVLVFFVVMATYEVARLCQQGDYKPATHWVAFCCAGLLFVPWIEMQQSMQPMLQSRIPLGLPLSVLWLMGGLIGSWLTMIGRKSTERVVAHLATSVFIMVYLGLMGGFVIRLRCMYPGAAGAFLFAYVVFVVKSGDIGAYFTGRAFGRTKLIPWLSPGKTIEGAVGAIIVAALVAAGGMLLWERLPLEVGSPMTIPQALVFGGLMAVVGHLGDLLASAIKRDVGSKDSGSVVKGFGGFLDIFDSPVFAAPVAWIALTFFAGMR